jgi:Caspase domain
MPVRFPTLLLAFLVVAGCTAKQPPANDTRALDVSQSAPRMQQGEGRRIALVVGNSRYASSPLTNPANDAELLATTLKDLGFEVRLLKNGDQVAMKRAIQEFGATLEKAGADSVGLFYYAGHGVQLNGLNYLIPVGANIDRDADVEIEAVSADWVLEQMRYARNRLNFVILDACRNNPFVRSSRSADRGLAKMDAPAGVLIAYSTAPGDVAADGAGNNSPYSEALARAMRSSDEPAELMFKQARDEVRRVTAERQTPWEASSLTGENFYFAATTAPKSVTRQPDPSSIQPVAPAAPAGPVTRQAASAPSATFSDTPVFMDDALCKNAVGEWRIESDAMKGRLKLDAQAGGAAKVTGKPAIIAVQWDCDAANRKFIIKYEDHVVHTVVMDGSEKLIFGYDQAGVPVIYTR